VLEVNNLYQQAVEASEVWSDTMPVFYDSFLAIYAQLDMIELKQFEYGLEELRYGQ